MGLALAPEMMSRVMSGFLSCLAMSMLLGCMIRTLDMGTLV